MSQAHFFVLINQMRSACDDAIAFADGFTSKDFMDDKKTQQAVVMSLIILGECATRALDRHAEIVAKFDDVPWRSMRGMRNRIAHGYSEINLELVWETVQKELPPLANRLREIEILG